MTKEEFKQKYFSNNFYWVNQNNYKELQEIGIEFGCVNPLGNKTIINWHNGFVNLGFRTRNEGMPTKFQKECFLTYNETATNYDEMILDYNNLNE